MKITLNPVKSIVEQNYTLTSLDYKLLESNLNSLIKLHQHMHKDTWIMACGTPGTGKSNLLLWIWQKINSLQSTPCILSQDVVETYEDLLVFLKQFFDIYGKTGIVDEGAFFANSRKSMTKDMTDLNEVMDVIRKRQKRILIAGSKPWKIDLAVRERTDMFLRTFYNVKEDQYQFAYYNGSRVSDILCDDKIIGIFADPAKFFKLCPPDFYGAIPKINDELDAEYQSYKDSFGMQFIDRKLSDVKRRTEKKEKANNDLFEIDEELEKKFLTIQPVDHKSAWNKPGYSRRVA